MIAIISDVHGNYPALCAVMGDIDELGVKEVYSLGDLCGYYSMVNEVIELIEKRNIINIIGNHDHYIISNTECPRSRSANVCLGFQKNIISQQSINIIKKSKKKFSNHMLNMVHGGWRDNLDEYLYDVNEDYFVNLKGRYFFSGHTHVPLINYFNTKTYCNPGSVGQPRDGDWRASYALLDEQNNRAIIRRVNYDVDQIAANMKNNGFDEYYFKNLYKGIRIGS